MTLKKSSRDPFASMFWNSVKKTRFVPIVTLVVLLLTTLLEFVFDYINGYYDWNQKRYGHFWDSILNGILLAVPPQKITSDNSTWLENPLLIIGE